MSNDVPIAGFAVSGFRTLQDVSIRAHGPVTVVCGPNNVGKSSLLASLELYPYLAAKLTGRKFKNSQGQPSVQGVSGALGVNLRREELQAKLMESSQKSRAERLWESLGEELPSLVWIPFSPGGSDPAFDADAALKPLKDGIAKLENPLRERAAKVLAEPFGTGVLDAKWLRALSRTCMPEVSFSFIADIRRTAEQPLTAEDLGVLARANARHTGRNERVEKWADQLEFVLRDVFGDDVRYEVWPTGETGDFRVLIDGEDNRELGQVGAGVREVVAIAYAALKDHGASVLAIEEPENCLHPIAVKRLLRSLPRRADVQLFVSTHSSAAINAGPDAVVHLSRRGVATTSRQIDDAVGRYEAVRSLGYSPADLVLTPCAVWVEGPSDRMYVTEWLAAHDLVEGIDYQVMFFGGALAARLSVSAETVPRSALAAIRNLGRHCAVVVDSDRDKAHAPLKKHVRRFREELEGDPHAHLLITYGREIENYLPVDIASRLRRKHGGRGLGESNYRYQRVLSPGLTRKVSKVRFAESALHELGGEVPEAARRDVSNLAGFIKTAVLP